MNIFSHPRFRVGWILILIATISSIGWSLVRWAYENGLNYAQITVDYDDTRTFADAVQISHRDLLRQLQSRGVSSVAIYQQTLGSLRDNGRIAILTREEAQAQYPQVEWSRYIPAYRFLVIPSQPELMEQILPRLVEQAQPSLLPKQVELTPATPTDTQDVATQTPATEAAAPETSTTSTTGQSGAEAVENGDVAQQTPTPVAPAAKTPPPLQGILIPASRQMVSDVQLGFDPAQVAVLSDLNLRVTARLSNSLNLNLDRLRRRLDEAQEVGAKVVIFSEDEVVGYHTLIPMVARELKQRQLLFGAIEFSKQRGLEEIMKRSDGMLVRVHSVAGDEAAKAKRDVLVERYVRAIKERNIRLAYIRMVRQFKGEWEIDADSDAGVAGIGEPIQPERVDTALSQNLEFIADVARELKRPPVPIMQFLRPGYRMSDAHGFRDFPRAWLIDHGFSNPLASLAIYLMRFLAGLGALGAAWLLLNLFFDLTRTQTVNLLFLGVFICAGLALSGGKGSQLLALGVGCLITPVALLWGGLPGAWDAWRQHGKFPPDIFAGQIKPGPAFTTACAVLVRTSAITLCGGFMTVALLNKWTYMSKADEYLGEKATQLLPLLIVGVAFAGKIFPHRVIVDGAFVARRQAKRSLDELLDNPFTVRYLMIGLFVLVAGFVWIARTGNDSGMDISPLELRMRAVMEQVFITRPRTKEVFLGHPALILAFYFGLRRRWPLFVGATIAATIGQADLYNTMCHIHTPLFYSLLRSFHAVWLGMLLGGLVLWLWHFIEERWRQRQNDAFSANGENPANGTSDYPLTPQSALPSEETVGRS